MDYRMEKTKDMIHKRVLMFMSAHPDVDFDKALSFVTSHLDRMIVEQYDKAKGECVLYDTKTGRRGKGPCEPVVKEPMRADAEVAARVSKYQSAHEAVSYSDALRTVLRDDGTLARAYRVGPGNFYYGDEN